MCLQEGREATAGPKDLAPGANLKSGALNLACKFICFSQFWVNVYIRQLSSLKKNTMKVVTGTGAMRQVCREIRKGQNVTDLHKAPSKGSNWTINHVHKHVSICNILLNLKKKKAEHVVTE